MRTALHRCGLGLAAALLTTTGLSTISTTPASAAAAVTCGPSAPNYDQGTSQVINKDPAYPTGVAMRTGPGKNCPLIVRVPWSAWVDLNCFRGGDKVGDVTTWSAVHYAQYFGWISDYYLSGDGSGSSC